MIVVIDASVWLSALLRADPLCEGSFRWLHGFLADEGTVSSPMTLVAEVAGAYARRTGQPDIAVRYAFELRTDPRVHLYSVDSELGDAAA